MGYTVWTNSVTVAYKTRPLYHPQRGLIEGREEAFTQETAYWFEPTAVVTGLTAEQAEAVTAGLERAVELPQRVFGDNATVKANAQALAHSRREDVVLRLFWVTPDNAPPSAEWRWRECIGAA